MAPYDVDLLCWRVVHDEDFHAQLLADPEVGTEGCGLTEEERAALLAGDVGRLYLLGSKPFLLEHLANHRVFGLDQTSFSESMRRAAASVQD